MSTKYKNSADVPLDVLVARLNELSDSITGGRESQSREFTMRIPAECDRDADLVLSEAANRIKQLQARVAELVSIVETFTHARTTSSPGTKAWLLRKQAVAVEECLHLSSQPEAVFQMRSYADGLRTQADEIEKAGGEG